MIYNSLKNYKQYSDSNDIELMQDLTIWTIILNLQSWDIRVSIVDESEMSFAGRGETTFNTQTQEAVIHIIDKDRYRKINPTVFEFDMERTLVHELLHLYFSPIDVWDKDDDKNTYLEQIVDGMSRILVQLKRQTKEGVFNIG